MLQTPCFLGGLGQLAFALAKGSSADPGVGYPHLVSVKGNQESWPLSDISCLTPRDRSPCQPWSCLVTLTHMALNPVWRKDPLGSAKEAGEL